MAHEDEWTEWHLTPSGWIMGNSKTTHSAINERVKPGDAVLTKRYRELQTHTRAKTSTSQEIIWSNGDEAIIADLQKSWPFPNSLQ